MLARFFALTVAVLLVGAGVARATTYTSDPNLSDFTGSVTVFGTFIQDSSGDVPLPYTPTAISVNAGVRVVGDDARTPIVVEFPRPVSNILVFPNIDHFGASYDGFQYAIAGSNDGVTWTPLFDALSVNGSMEPFTLGSFTGTAPTFVNNVLTPGAGPEGTVGYGAQFNFGRPFRFFSFASSTVANDADNQDAELSAVGALTQPAPAVSGGVLAGLAAALALVGAALAARRRLGPNG